MIARNAALLLAFLAPLTSRAETDWPQFRGPTGQGLSAASNLPTRWSATDNVAWRVEVPGRGWSSPVISNNRIYLTTATNNAQSLRALCFDATNGNKLWDVEVLKPAPGAARAMHQKNSPASPTPVVTADHLYVHFGHMGTAALDLAGKVLWTQTDLKYAPVHGGGGSPAVVGDLLVFSADGARDPFLAALDTATGKLRWKIPRNTRARNTFSFSTPLLIEVDGQPQIILPASGMVGAYDPIGGRELWRVTYGEGYSVVPRPVFAHGLLFVASGFDRPTLYAINPKGATGDATKTNIAWRMSKNAPLTPSPVVVGDEIYCVADNGFATCTDAKTGATHWTQRLAGNFSASPLAAGDRVYFQSESGDTFVVKAAKTFEQLAENKLDERTLASPAVHENSLIVRSESHLWRIGK